MGDVDEALASSEAVVEGSITTTRQEHMYEETNNVLVVPVGEDEEYKVYGPISNQLMAQHTVAMCLGLPFNRVTFTTKRVNKKAFFFSLFLPMELSNRLGAVMVARSPASYP